MVTIPLVAAALFNRLYSLLFKCFYVKMVCVFFFLFLCDNIEGHDGLGRI